MKTPNEIKKGLECCTNEDNAGCGDCPYDSGGRECGGMLPDALAYIQQLEAANAELLTKIEQLETKCHQLEQERDAAVESIRDSSHCCDFCKHNKWGCTSHAEPDGSCFEWRGVKEE